MTVAVIGAGVSGMAMGLRLRDVGVPFTIFEKGGEVGGTWRDNRYPGLTIDVPSPLYTFSSHRHAGWTRWMPKGSEILDYHRDVATRTGLRDRIAFDTEIVDARWADDEWVLTSAAGETHRARAVVCATGFLHRPRWPDVPGLDDFDGALVHSARWRDDIPVPGRRVGVIGCGSTGVQLVGALAGVASHLTLFQRTPQWILPALNFPIPRFARRLLARAPGLIDRLADGIEALADWFVGAAAMRPGLRRRCFDLVARLHLATVRDPQLRARLTPADAPLCKRPVISSRFYRAVQRRDVAVVDAPIDHVCATGVATADGQLHELDVLVLATGFEAHAYMRPMTITGEGGITLDEAWAEGPCAYRTVALPGFPNLFTIMGPHSPLLYISIHGSAELQADYVMQMLKVLERDDVVSVAPTEAATRRWLEYIEAGMDGTVWSSGCASWYLGAGTTPVLWPYGREAWRELLRTPVLDDFEVRTVAALAETPTELATAGQQA